MEETGPRWYRNPVTGGLLIVLVMLVCVAGAATAANIACTVALKQKLPIYPGAEIVWERHNLVTAFGMGETYMILESPDDREVVHEWYNRYSASLLRERANDTILRLGRAIWDVNMLEGGGSQIVLHGTCMQ